MANTRLTRTPSSAGSYVINTWSFWVKRGTLSSNQNLFNAYVSSSNKFRIKFTPSDQLEVGYFTGSWDFQIVTNRKFRDTSAWFHIVVAQKANESTATDRIKVYVNGVRETSFATTNFPSANEGSNVINATNATQNIGSSGAPDHYFDGSMSHVHFADGSALAPTVFGETDSTTGEWKIKTSPSFTPGTNGFTILKDGNTITDQSANSNNFSTSGAGVTTTKDCPSNVFATLNPLIKFNSSYSVALSNGNTTLGTSTGSTNSNPTPTTFGITTGKYYWETKFVSLASGTAYALTGIMAQNPAGEGNYLGGYNDSYGYGSWNGVVYNNGGSTGNTTGGATYGVGDILSMAFDADNNRLYYYKNGAIQNSGTGIVIPAASTTVLGAWFPAVGDWGSTTHVWSCNFGNGFFGTTAVTTNSGNGYAGADGKSKFNYAVPSGYSALSTKGLNQ